MDTKFRRNWCSNDTHGHKSTQIRQEQANKLRMVTQRGSKKRHKINNIFCCGASGHHHKVPTKPKHRRHVLHETARNLWENWSHPTHLIKNRKHMILIAPELLKEIQWHCSHPPPSVQTLHGSVGSVAVSPPKPTVRPAIG